MTEPPDPTARRKEAMQAAGLTGADISNALGFSEGMVSQVINGDRLTFPASRKIMAYVANFCGEEIAALWPELPATTSEPKEA